MKKKKIVLGLVLTFAMISPSLAEVIAHYGMNNTENEGVMETAYVSVEETSTPNINFTRERYTRICKSRWD